MPDPASRDMLRLVPTAPVEVLPHHEDADPDISRALGGLIGRFEAFIRRTALRHGLRGQELDDVVQDLQVRIWKSFGTSELIRRARANYMYRATVSASLDIVRRRRALKRQAASLDDVDPQLLEDRRMVTDARVNQGELARAIHDALLELHESRRAVVRMYLAGYDRFEIAALLRWTEPKTRNLLYRGLEDLRTVLAARGITRPAR